MGDVISIDFGTTNTVVAEWVEALGAARTVTLPGLSYSLPGSPPSIPSLLYLDDARARACRVGNTVLSSGLYDPKAEDASRLFRSMKRAVLEPDAREFQQEFRDGGIVINNQTAAELFLEKVCREIVVSGRSITELVLTVPVTSFERYLRWISGAIQALSLPPGTLPRLIDEPTAAAFGYGLDSPGSHVLVIDFGGGTLDLSLVRLPEERESVGRGIVIRPDTPPRAAVAAQQARMKARVIAKASARVGGDDIDKVFIDHLLERHNLRRDQVLGDLHRLRIAVEATKIALTKSESEEIDIFLRTQRRSLVMAISRQGFEENVLNARSLNILEILRRTIADLHREADKQKVADSGIDHVLLVGGTTLIPVIRDLIVDRFGGERVLNHQPFEAVAHGALMLATSHPLEDILQHSYALEIKREASNGHVEFDYIPLVKAGSSFPFEKPLPFGYHLDPRGYLLKPMADDAHSISFVIAEIKEDPLPGRRTVYAANGETLPTRGKDQVEHAQTVRLLRNECEVPLDPPGMRSHDDRLDVRFTVDENRRLLITVYDNHARRHLMTNEPVTRLE